VLTGAILCCLILLGLAFLRRRNRKRQGELIEEEESIELISELLPGINKEVSVTDSDRDTDSRADDDEHAIIQRGTPDYIQEPRGGSDSTEYNITLTHGTPTPPEPSTVSYSDSSQIELPSTQGVASVSDDSQLEVGGKPKEESLDSGNELIFPGGGSSQPQTVSPERSVSGESEIRFPGGGSGPKNPPSTGGLDSGSSDELVFPGGKPDDDNANQASDTPSSSEEEELVFNWFR